METIMMKITQIVCDYLSIDIKHAKSKSRKKEYVNCRHIICYMIYKHTTYTQFEISKFIGYNQRSNISHTVKSVNELKNSNVGYNFDLENINKLILIETKGNREDDILLSLKKEYGILYNKLHDINFNPESKYYIHPDLSKLEDKSKEFLKDLNTFIQQLNINHDKNHILIQK